MSDLIPEEWSTQSKHIAKKSTLLDSQNFKTTTSLSQVGSSYESMITEMQLKPIMPDLHIPYHECEAMEPDAVSPE